MFKRLRERIAEEATKFPVGQLNSNTGKQLSDSENKATGANSTEDLITLSDSSAVVVPHTSSQQFSIGEDEDGSVSEQSTPHKKLNEAANGSTNEHSFYTPGARDHPAGTGSDLSFCLEYRPTKSNYIPQSDIESEREDPPTLNLDSISKDQLLTAIELLKARAYKYKNKYVEVVKNYKELRDEKLKIENTLIEQQDKGLRRIAELREQCQLEQKAKAHLEANLRLLLEEKDSRITVLETQINFLKENVKADSLKTPSEISDTQNSDASSAGTQSDSSSRDSPLEEKVERLEHQFNQARKTITAQTDQISLLRKQNEGLSQELEEKMKRLNDMEDEQGQLKSKHEFILQGMQNRLKELESQQEESVMSMAETKKNMHEELELKEKQLIKAEEEAKQHQAMCETEKMKVLELQKQHEEKINNLQHQLESTERMLEDEKQNLMQELGRGKSAAIALMQQECAKKIAAIEEEWKIKFEDLQKGKESTRKSKEEVSEKKIKLVAEEVNQQKQQIEELNSIIDQLEKENSALKQSLENLKSDNLEVRSEECLKSLKYKLETAEKNYATQMDEMKSRILVLEEEKCALQTEKSELLKAQEKFKSEESAINSELKLKEDELCKVRQNYEISNKEQVAKIHSFQETMKDKENMIVKLIANIEFLKKENSDKNDELKRKISKLEEEREHLMIQAQERVSNTEAKCREDIKALQERNNKLLVENGEIEKLNSKISLIDKQLSESRRLAESNEVAAREEIALLRNQLTKAEEKLSEAERKKLEVETELSKKVRKLEEENSSLLGRTNHFESLKAEKEELNEKLKQAEQQVTSIKTLETERDMLKNENTTILKELELLKASQPDDESLQDKIEALKENEEILRDELEELRKNKKVLENELSELRASFEKERETLKSEIEKLLKQISLLEKMSSDPQSTASKDYIAVIRGECETAIKAKEEEMETKLKHLVRDFCIQMDVKDNDCDKMMSELLEKNQDLEDKLMREHRKEVAELRQNLFEQECAFEETRDNYEKTLQEKVKEVKELQSTIKKLMDSSHNNASPNDVPVLAESSDWDDTWAVPEESVENASPVPNTEHCKEHLQQIETLQNEITKCNSEIKELKILLRLSPPESMPNSIRKDPSQSVPEPTEFEYLKNIIYEYMMGKEPITLAKVIAAVLRFSDTQTQQVIRREEARHPAK